MVAASRDSGTSAAHGMELAAPLSQARGLKIGSFASLPHDRFAFVSTETGYPLLHTLAVQKQVPCHFVKRLLTQCLRTTQGA